MLNRPISLRLIEKIIPRDNGCWEWSGARIGDGYGWIGIHHFPKLAHRVSYETFVGPIPDGMCVCHICDNPPCINPSHLFIGTRLDNAIDRDKKGRTAHGESSGCAKLTLQDIKKIRKLHASGLGCRKLSKQFGVGRAHIMRIIREESWRNE